MTAGIRVLGLCGSLRAQSSNRQALEAARLLAPAPMRITLFEGLAALPYFNPDLDGDEPPGTVLALRRAIGEADALLISSPEYARGVSGVFKNALDWLVASFEFPGKPVAVINTSQRSTHADAALRLTLETMSAWLIEAGSITLPLNGLSLDARGIAADPALSAQLRGALDAIAQFQRSHGTLP